MSPLSGCKDDLFECSTSTISDIDQLDGNTSIPPDSPPLKKCGRGPPPQHTTITKMDRLSAAISLPTVATYNLRSLMPKQKNLTTDVKERKVDCAFLQEIWTSEDNKNHQLETEKLLEWHGLKYLATTRKPNKRGVSHGGAAILVNLENFLCQRLNIHIPQNLEIVWALLQPRSESARFKKIITCSFYSPPNKRRNSKMADHIVGTLQMLACRYPGSAIILGADINQMDIAPLLNCGLRLRQVVDQPTRQGVILDVIIMNTFPFYKSPIIAPPIEPDDPLCGKPSDHSVPVCVPHTDRYTRPSRHYRTVKYRPLPESGLRMLGEWIVKEQWEGVKGVKLTPTEQADFFQKITLERLDKYCPEKFFKTSSQDKSWVTAELKKLARQKSREYEKRGKSVKYKELAKNFKEKYNHEASKFLRKKMDDLKESKPGQAYNILKKMGAQPGDCIDANTFSLPTHEEIGLTSQQSAERIADYFASISQEFQPLDQATLPMRVQNKISRVSHSPPVMEDYEIYQAIKHAKKPKSGLPDDLPRQMVIEYAPELSTPICSLVNNILQSGEWPDQWKMEWVTPIAKVAVPETEDDLRPISLTPFFSKVTEQVIVKWLLHYIGDKMDFRQYGGIKGNSICHYIIEFINFILLNQDSSEQTAVLACMVDFNKAFNRIDHNNLITKLSDMGVPGWLLKVVIGFLSNRRMVVRYKGKISDIKSLPGGGPQGTLLGLFLFLILINDCGFEGQANKAGELLTTKRNMRMVNEIHLKYVDDLSLAESINLPVKLKSIPDSDRPLPDVFRARTGHIFPTNRSVVYRQLLETEKFAKDNHMQINYKKTKLMLFNPCRSIDFMPEIVLGGQQLEVVEKIRLLGVTIRADLKWSSNTSDIVKRAANKLWLLRRIKKFGANIEELVDLYSKYCRSILEFAVPVWHNAITVHESNSIERVQKMALHIILGDKYRNYETALGMVGLETLVSRRTQLCINFAKKAVKHSKFKHWFREKPKVSTRQPAEKYWGPVTRTTRLKQSAIPYLTSLLNTQHMK